MIMKWSSPNIEFFFKWKNGQYKVDKVQIWGANAKILPTELTYQTDLEGAFDHIQMKTYDTEYSIWGHGNSKSVYMCMLQ
jgi:hypothetical protein